jgi:spore germination protein GerM
MAKRTSRILVALLTLALIGAAMGLAACSPEEPADETAADEVDAVETAEEESEEPEEPEDLTVMVYFGYGGDRAMAVERTIPYTTGVAAAALEELFAGPTESELDVLPLLHTEIPAGTGLLGLAISGGVAKVNLSGEFESGGGTASVTTRVAQVVYTLAQFPTVDAVEFYLEGELVEVFSGEGLMFDGPQEPEDYYDLVPVDA